MQPQTVGGHGPLHARKLQYPQLWHPVGRRVIAWAMPRANTPVLAWNVQNLVICRRFKHDQHAIGTKCLIA